MSDPKRKDFFEAIDAYAAGELPAEELEAFEAALFTEEGLAEAATWQFLVEGVRLSNGMGLRHGFGPRARVDHILELGLAVEFLDLGDEDEIAPQRVPPPCDVVVTRYSVDLTGVREVELDMGVDDTVYKTVPSTFDANDGAIWGFCVYALSAQSFAHLQGHHGLMRVYSVEPEGRRLLREFLMPVEPSDSP